MRGPETEDTCCVNDIKGAYARLPCPDQGANAIIVTRTKARNEQGLGALRLPDSDIVNSHGDY